MRGAAILTMQSSTIFSASTAMSSATIFVATRTRVLPLIMLKWVDRVQMGSASVSRLAGI